MATIQGSARIRAPIGPGSISLRQLNRSRELEIAFHLNREYLVNTGTALLTHFITQSNLKIPPSFGYLQGYIIPSTNSNLFKRKEKKLPFTETAKIQRNISTTPLSHSPYAFSTISTPPPVQRPYFHPLQLATISHPLGALCSSELTSPDGEARKESSRNGCSV